MNPPAPRRADVQRGGCAIAPDPVSVDVTYHLTVVPVAKKSGGDH